MQELACPFRIDPRATPDGEVATCGLLQRLIQVNEPAAYEVPRDACDACCVTTTTAARTISEVFPSLLYSACDQVLQSIEAGETHARLRTLREEAELALLEESLGTPRSTTPACDVFVCCADSSPQTQQSVDSLLNQRGAVTIIHLIDDGGGASRLAEHFEGLWNVVVHRNDRRRGLFASVQDLVACCQTQFIALHDAKCFSFPERIRLAVAALEAQGGELLATNLQSSTGEVPATKPEPWYGRYVPWPTIVLRRATFVDMSGFADRVGDQDAEFVFRAAQEGRSIILSSSPTVRSTTAWDPPPVGAMLGYGSQGGSLSCHAIGFPQSLVSCDVVIPFRGQIEYLDAAIESVLGQDGAETVVHLVDDASQDDTDAVLRYWNTHPHVRVYRNSRNIGQYASFNNVSEYFETNFAAVQDADDISLPHRFQVSGNLLRLCDADFFGGAMEQFGDTGLLAATIAERPVRASRYPQTFWIGYFLMKPTAFFRVATFRSVGGYTDLGGPRYNRAGLDTEFLIRTYYAGVRFAISREVVCRHRIHQDSATQAPATGFGSQIRERAFLECDRRRTLFQQDSFDARAFGGIGRYRGVTHHYKR